MVSAIEEDETRIKNERLHKPSIAFSLISAIFFLFYALPVLIPLGVHPEEIGAFFATHSTFCWIVLSAVLALLLASLLYAYLARGLRRSLARFVAIALALYSLSSLIVGLCLVRNYATSNLYLADLLLALFLGLLGANVYYFSSSYRIYRVARGDPFLQLTWFERRRLSQKRDNDKIVSILFFEVLGWLFFLGVLLVCLWIYPDITSNEPGSLAFVYGIIVFFSAYPLLGFGVYLLGAWFYNRYVMFQGPSRRSRWMMFPLLAAIVVGSVGMPLAYQAGMAHREWSATYSREKWQAADPMDRSWMIVDFQKKVFLPGKGYDEMIYYLGEADKKETEELNLYYDYYLGSRTAFHGTYKEYFRVTFQQEVIVETHTFSQAD